MEKLQTLAETVKLGSLCGLGQTAPNPVLTTIKYFRGEYDEHIKNKQCGAAVCKGLIQYSINPDNCTGCTVCKGACPTSAISGEPKKTCSR